MMMIAFITISSLVPLIESLCTSDSISIRILGFTFTSFALRFQKEKDVNPITPYSICIHMCTLDTYMMMMVAFITFNSSLVLLIDGLCSSNP